MATRHGRQVEALLKQYEVCRNSDSNLIIGMLHVNGVELSHESREIVRSLNFEGITRARRKFQEKGMYMPTDPKVIRKRRLKAMEIEQVAPVESATGLHDRISRNV